MSDQNIIRSSSSEFVGVSEKMKCFTMNQKIVVGVFGLIIGVVLTLVYFLLLFMIRISIEKQKGHLKRKAKLKKDE